MADMLTVASNVSCGCHPERMFAVGKSHDTTNTLRMTPKLKEGKLDEFPPTEIDVRLFLAVTNLRVPIVARERGDVFTRCTTSCHFLL